jgi:hypothetical protein
MTVLSTLADLPYDPHDTQYCAMINVDILGSAGGIVRLSTTPLMHLVYCD